MSRKGLLAVLMATTMLGSGVALAANEAPPSAPPGHAAAMSDFVKLSSDAARGYQDVALTRLAIFDGRANDAKKYVDEAESAFGKAKNDNSVFTKAETDLRAHEMKPRSPSGQTAEGQAGGGQSGTQAAATPPGQAQGGQAANARPDASKPIAWLPVDGAVSIAEDYSLQPAKAKAVTEANKSLASGDRKGAMEKLRLADVNLDVMTAVVPLQQTLTDVHDAAQLIDSGKYYEGSQKLRDVTDSTIFTLADIPATPASGQTTAAPNGNGQPPSAHNGASPAAPAKQH